MSRSQRRSWSRRARTTRVQGWAYLWETRQGIGASGRKRRRPDCSARWGSRSVAAHTDHGQKGMRNKPLPAAGMVSTGWVRTRCADGPPRHVLAIVGAWRKREGARGPLPEVGRGLGTGLGPWGTTSKVARRGAARQTAFLTGLAQAATREVRREDHTLGTAQQRGRGLHRGVGRAGGGRTDHRFQSGGRCGGLRRALERRTAIRAARGAVIARSHTGPDPCGAPALGHRQRSVCQCLGSNGTGGIIGPMACGFGGA